MKKLIAILFLALVIKMHGQIKTRPLHDTGDIQRMTTNLPYSYPVMQSSIYDTVVVVMLVSASQHNKSDEKNVEEAWTAGMICIAISGYEVLKQHDHRKENYVYEGKPLYWVHYAYLDHNKQPIRYFVWLSKQIK